MSRVLIARLNTSENYNSPASAGCAGSTQEWIQRVLAYIHRYIDTRIHTYIHAYIHTYVTYVTHVTHIHTYIHTYTYIGSTPAVLPRNEHESMT